MVLRLVLVVFPLRHLKPDPVQLHADQGQGQEADLLKAGQAIWSQEGTQEGMCS